MKHITTYIFVVIFSYFSHGQCTATIPPSNTIGLCEPCVPTGWNSVFTTDGASQFRVTPSTDRRWSTSLPISPFGHTNFVATRGFSTDPTAARETALAPISGLTPGLTYELTYYALTQTANRYAFIPAPFSDYIIYDGTPIVNTSSIPYGLIGTTIVPYTQVPYSMGLGVWHPITVTFTATSSTATLALRTGNSTSLAATSVFSVDPSGVVCPCSISDITTSNISACNDNGTPFDGSDDFFTADITVTFTSAPSLGTLNITGDTTQSVSIGSLDTTSSHTFTNVSMTPDGTPINLTATFSDDTTCTLNLSLIHI